MNVGLTIHAYVKRFVLVQKKIAFATVLSNAGKNVIDFPCAVTQQAGVVCVKEITAAVAIIFKAYHTPSAFFVTSRNMPARCCW